MSGIYIHIPVCESKCNYCDFYSVTSQVSHQEYINLLIKELQKRRDELPDKNIKTVYFGGGTPSLFSPKEFVPIFDFIYDSFDIANDAEISIELNPDDVDESYLDKLKQLPFNRISIGLQSFNDEHLKFLGRRHNSGANRKVLDLLWKYNYSNVSVDCIYGIPGSSLEDIGIFLSELHLENIKHVSAYHLTIEEKTPLYFKKEQGAFVELTDNESFKQYTYLVDALEKNGFSQYEISNFSKTEYHSKHNSAYWKRKAYLGIGAAAHSFLETYRSYNPSCIESYKENILSPIFIPEIENLSEADMFNETIMTGLRTIKGVNLQELKSSFPQKFTDYINLILQESLNPEWYQISNNSLKLTKKGMFISDFIISELFFVE